MNYKNEPFISFDQNIIGQLDRVAEKITEQLNTPEKYIVFNEHSKFSRKEFSSIWKHTKTNSPKGKKDDFKGVYAFGNIENEILKIQYIGISQEIRSRFFGHTTSRSKNAATWAYLISKHKNSNLTKEERTALIPSIQEKLIRNCRFTFVPLDCNMTIQLAEVYCANKLKAYWNSFETH